MSVMNKTGLEGSKVLLVEDEFFVAYDIAFSIEEAGGVVAGPVATVAMARTMLEDHAVKIDAAILDMNLRDGSAEELVAELHRRAVPVVVNTGEPLPLAFQAELPDIPVFSKPTNPALLAQALERQLNG